MLEAYDFLRNGVNLIAVREGALEGSVIRSITVSQSLYRALEEQGQKPNYNWITSLFPYLRSNAQNDVGWDVYSVEFVNPLVEEATDVVFD